MLARADSFQSDKRFGGFGQDGILEMPLTTDLGGAYLMPFTVLPDGRMMMAIQRDFDFVVRRYHPDGIPDSSFGGTGEIVTDVDGRADKPFAIALQADGKILVAGCAGYPSVGGEDFALVRYLPNGAVDPDFGQNGRVITDFGQGSDCVLDLVLQQDGKIVAAGYAFDKDGFFDPGDYDFGIARYTTDGTLDGSFSGDGLQNFGFGEDDEATQVFIQEDGKILLGGRSKDRYAGVPTSSKYTPVIGRLLANGSLDNSYNENGRLQDTEDRMSFYYYKNTYALQDDGKLLSTSSGRITRWTVNGFRDDSEGSFGQFGRINDAPYTQVLFVGGKIFALERNFEETRLVRLNDDGSRDPTFQGTWQTAEHTALVALASGQFMTAGYEASTDTLTLRRIMPDGSADDGGRVLAGHRGPQPLDNRAQAAAIEDTSSQPAIVVAGSAGYGTLLRGGVGRFHHDGTLDQSFGSNGLLLIGALDSAQDLAIAPNNDVVVAGTTTPHGQLSSDIAVARVLADGSGLANFGPGGQGSLTTDLGGSEVVEAVAIQPDGRILLAGSTAGGEMLLLRYNAGGSLDPTFGLAGTGIVVADFDQHKGTINDIKVLDNGKILAAGTVYFDGGQSDFRTVRFLSNGRPDPDFGGGDGKVTSDILNSSGQASAVQVYDDGRVLVGGTITFPGGFQQMALLRLTEAGVPDTSFNGTGKQIVADLSNPATAHDITLLPSGHILIAGCSQPAQLDHQTFVMAHFDDTGTAAPGLENGSHTVLDFGGEACAQSMVLGPLGEITLAGYAQGAVWESWALGRYTSPVVLPKEENVAYAPVVSR